MLVILLGAIGGMMSSGLLGLFVGPVVLSLGYKVFQAWLINDAPVSQPSGIAGTINAGEGNK
jgi:predicted PurR-regulated permease PerM